MIIVKLTGGLGTQMSQYAYAKALSMRGLEVKIDPSGLKFYKLHDYELFRYNIDLNVSTKGENDKFHKFNFIISILCKWFTDKLIVKFLNRAKVNIYTSQVLKEESHLFNQDFLEVSDNSYMIGDFKSEKYFKNIRNILLEQFVMKDKPSKYLEETEMKIAQSNNSCFIHVRRGDFVDNKKTFKVHGVCEADYYHSAAEYVSSRIKDLEFFIFSNDLDWCKKNLKIANATFVENKRRKSPHEDIHLMSLCQHSIIDHSAFCWWGAWLNQNNDNIVVAPAHWFANKKLREESKDIYCESWIKVQNSG
jgi:hypothetical protein